MPGIRHIQGVMHAMYASTKEALKEKIKGFQFISLTCDTWTSVNKHAFTAVSVHGISNSWELTEHITAVEYIKVHLTLEISYYTKFY